MLEAQQLTTSHNQSAVTFDLQQQSTNNHQSSLIESHTATFKVLHPDKQAIISLNNKMKLLERQY